mmetsp:Transcript_102850/g.235907  ORF Transcript_102850/g.235907 Transcript_102850/m.235907 type:complete len:266 (-) Transcript_102850:425-1222(-)
MVSRLKGLWPSLRAVTTRAPLRVMGHGPSGEPSDQERRPHPRNAEESLDQLFQYCSTAVQAGSLTPVPTKPVSDTMISLLNGVTAESLGVSPADVPRHAGKHTVFFQHILECPSLSLCIFLIPRGSCIPLHDHPHMSVFGRLLFGKMQVRSYDIDNVASSDVQNAMYYGQPVRATRATSGVLGPDPATYQLTPSFGNLHELTAIEDCSFFDVIFPPYGAEGRDCTYFSTLQDVSNKPGAVLLQPSAPPDDLSVSQLPYKGPAFQW